MHTTRIMLFLRTNQYQHNTMAKKDEQNEALEQSSTPNFDKWRSNLRGKYGEDKSDEELYELSMNGYDEEHESNKRYSSEASELQDIMTSDPDLAVVFAEIFERGKDGNPAGALRHLPEELKRYITDENYGDDEYLADRKKSREAEDAKKAKDEQTQKLREQAFEEVCAEDGVADPEAALRVLQGVFDNPCETLEQCKDQVRSFLKMADYDDAVEAAEVRGRNANIAAERKRKSNSSDGLANGASAAGGVNSLSDPLSNMASRAALTRNL